MNKTIIKNVYDYLKRNNMRIAYCPNENLGLDGPFKEVDLNEMMEIINETTQEIKLDENMDVMISG